MSDDGLSPASESETRFAELLRSSWVSIARSARSMEHLPTLPNAHVEVLQRVIAANGLTPAQLATDMHLARPTISDLTRKMTQDGLLERRPSPNDGRSVILVPTEHARDLIDGFSRGVAEVVAEGLRRLSARDANRLLGDVPALAQLSGHLKAIADRSESEANRRAESAEA